MRIGDFARIANVSVRAVRFYDQTGLLSAVRVDPASGYRHYDVSQLGRLCQIRTLQDLGFSLKEIREFLQADFSDSAVRARMQERKAELQRQIRGDAIRLARIEGYLRDGASVSNFRSGITLRESKASWVVSLRAKLKQYDEADEMFVELEKKIPAHLCVGHRSALWHSCESSGSHIDCEVVRFTKERASVPRGLNTYMMPSARVACIFHCDGEESIGQSYQTLTHWLASSDLRLRGTKREIYWTEPRSKEASQCITEIQFPVTRVAAKRSRAA